MQNITILGSTGSVGVSTLEVIAAHAELFKVFALSAKQNVETLFQQCQSFYPVKVVMVEEVAAQRLRDLLADSGEERLGAIEVLSGEAALEDISSDEVVDAVMAAIVGAAGLKATMAAAYGGKRVLLANKESLVMSGTLFTNAVRDNKAELLPIDSEHNAIFQCMPIVQEADQSKLTIPAQIDPVRKKEIKKIILTASGGPFWEREAATFDSILPQEACKHPKWDMGRKISVDSATLMNKGLEVIEACLLFDVKPEQVEVIIHPQSIVHSLVEYIDGSIIAQMANPDMKIPIAYGLAWPDRIASGVKFLDLVKTGSLNFYKPDTIKFPCLDLAYQAMKSGGNAPATLNAANEIAVAAFLDEKISFTQISEVIEKTLKSVPPSALNNLEDVLEANIAAREFAEGLIEAVGSKRLKS